MSDPTNPQNPTNTDPLAALTTILADIKRDDGSQKYNDPATALQALKDSQEHIKRLEQEKKDLLEGKEKTAIEKLLEKISVPQTQPAVTPQVAAGVTPEDVRKILAEEEIARAQAGNDAAFKAKLVEKFGDKAVDVLQARAKELGVDVATIGAIARKSPAAALSMIGAAATQPSTPSATRGTVVPSAAASQVPDKSGPSPFRIGNTTADLVGAWERAKAKVQG